MLKLDATDLYDLSEAGRLLFKDAARLAREARLRKIPAARVGQALGLPQPWVDAAAGLRPVDEESLRRYWLERLAPPSPSAHRPVRARDRLPVETLLTAEEAARRVFADARALERLDRDGTLPSIRVDGRAGYDPQLTDLVARAEAGDDVRAAAEARRAEVLAWARFEYATADEAAHEGASIALPRPHAAPQGVEPVGAFEIPADLDLDAIAPLEEAADADAARPSTLIEADGFRTVDED